MKIESRRSSAAVDDLCRDLLGRNAHVRLQVEGVSMSPTIRSGDFVRVRPVEASALRRGDIVLARSGNRLRAHRVVEIEDGGAAFTTRGDSSDERDEQIQAEQVVGLVVGLKNKNGVDDKAEKTMGGMAKAQMMLRASMYRAGRNFRRSLKSGINRIASGSQPFAIGLLLLLACLQSASAAVGIDSTTSVGQEIPQGAVDSSSSTGVRVSTGAGNSTFTFNHTTAGANRLLLVGVSINLTNNANLKVDPVAAITYNGTKLTLIGTVVNGVTRRVEIWSLTAPVTGTHAIQVNMLNANATATGVVVGATTFTGVNQATPLGTFASNTGVATNNPNVAVASAVGELVFGVMGAGGNRTVAVNGGETAQWNQNSGGNNANTDVRGLGVTAPGAASVTLSETLSNTSNWAYGGIDIKPATSSITFAHTTAGANTLMIVGISVNLSNNAAVVVNSVTYNNVGLTKIGVQNDAGNTRRIEMWRLLAPTAGVNNVVVTIGGVDMSGTSFGVVAGATTFTGVDQNTPLGTFASASDSSGADANPRVRATSNPGEIVIDTMATGGDQTVTGQTSVQTAQWNLNSTNNDPVIDVTGYGSTAAGAANVTMAESLSAASNWAIGAISVKPLTAELSITKSVSPNPPVSGSNATYTITVTNNGPSGATGVTVTDPLPANVTFVSATPSQGACVGTTTQTCTLGAIANGASATITIVVTVNSLTGLNNTVTVTANENDSNPANNTATNVANTQTASCATTTAPPAGGVLTGTLNTYFPGPANTTLASGARTVTLGAGTGAATPIAINDELLIIQMQDAAINSTNTDSYGDGVAGVPAAGSTNLNNAGIYEYVTATNAVPIGGGVLNFTGTGTGGGLLYSYTNANATAAQGQRQFQVIRVPQFSTATLSSTLTAKRWGCTFAGAVPTCTGGVLALDVAQTLTLGGTVDLTGFGFQGAGGVLLTGGATGGLNTDFRFNSPAAPPVGSDGSKGEGIAGTPKYTFNQVTGALNALGPEGYPNGSFGKGAPGNAGGGATDADPAGAAGATNDQNAGGGGGGNVGTGGNGGDSWNSALASGGFGGATFPATQLRVAMGGGGGAGDTNNGTSDPNTNTTGINSSGAAGGGIVIIRANTVAGTGTIQSNGANALNVQNDGGGGGGAGGSVILLAVNGSLANLTVNAKGGNGGNTWAAQPPGTPYPGNLHGPGGGGGGGVIILTSAPLASSVLGGANGTSTTAADPFGASAGIAGLVITNASSTLTSGQNSGAACTDLSVVKTSSPNPVKTGNSLVYTLTITNNGFNTSPAVTLSDTLPGNVSFVSDTTTQGSCAQAAGTVTCNLGSMNAGATATVTITVTAGAPSLLSNTGTVTNPQTDFNTANNSSTDNNVITFPTAVGLQSFTATREDGAVVLRWVTGAETRNLGFNIYRDANGQRVKLNPSLIAGSALTLRQALPMQAGKRYAWIDDQPGVTSSYWLEDVDLNGSRTWHGSEQATGGMVSRLATARSATFTELRQQLPPDIERPGGSSRLHWFPHLPPPTNSQRETQFRLAASRAIKISVQHEGLYRITQAQLSAAGFPGSFDSRFLHLYAEGNEQPIRIVGDDDKFGPGSAIEFYGTGIDTPYSDTRVYWLALEPGPGARMPRVEPGLSNDIARSFPFTVERKDRTTYFAALLNGEADNFFGAVLTPSPTDQTLTLKHLDPSSTEDVHLKVTLQGVTSDIAHRVAVNLNGGSVGEVNFDGQAQGVAAFSVPGSLVHEGDNTVTLTALNGDDDISLVDTIQLTYRHAYAAESDKLEFSAPSGQVVVLQGFTGPKIRVFDITSPSHPFEVVPHVKQNGSSFSAIFGAPWAGLGIRNFLAVEENAFDQASSVVMNSPSQWHLRQRGADMVMISGNDFVSALAPLQKLHAAQGTSVAMVKVDDLYDEFNFGEKTAFAIREFLSLTQQKWQVPPHFVLFGGRASLDPRNYLGLGDLDFVPTKIIDTSQLETASDDWFSDFSNAGIAQLPTGRLPVSTPAEAGALVNKILSYNSGQNSGPWLNQAMLVADQNIGFDFSGATTALQSLLPSSLSVTRVIAGDIGEAAARAQVLAGLDGGKLLVNYAGHGSVEVWAGGLLTSDDAAALSNGSKLPVIVTMDCLNGFFQDVYTHSLAASLLLAGNGGAIAVWASSGLTEPAPQAQMDQALIRNLFGGGHLSLGDAALQAKSGIADPDVRRTWILFGDPAMHLAGQSALPGRN